MKKINPGHVLNVRIGHSVNPYVDVIVERNVRFPVSRVALDPVCWVIRESLFTKHKKRK